MKKYSFSDQRMFIALTVAFGLASGPATASHHFESALSKQFPEYDLTDMFVFEAEKPGYTVFMMDINPTTKDDGKPLFGDKGVYSFHIASNREMTGKGLTITAHVDGSDFVIGIADGANPAIGTKGNAVGRVPIGSAKELDNGMRVWTGAARDPFIGNAVGIRKFRQELSEGKLDVEAFGNAEDFFGNLFTSAIVMEVPNTLLPPEIAAYASSAMYNVDKWEQVNRLANPLMTHLFMYDNPMETTEHVAHRPDTDASRKYAVSGTVLRAVALDGKIREPVAYADSIANWLLPDMITYKVGTEASYGIDAVNGRKTTNDAMDVALSLFVGRPVTDNANTFDHHPDTFPYVVPVGAGGQK